MTSTGLGSDRSLFCLCLLECLIVLGAFLLIPQLELPSSDGSALAGVSLLSGLRVVSFESLAPAVASMLRRPVSVDARMSPRPMTCRVRSVAVLKSPPSLSIVTGMK